MAIALASALNPPPIDRYLELAPLVIEAAREITARIGQIANTVVLPARSLR